MNRAYLGIGANIGDKKANIEKALDLLKADYRISITKVSSYYETEPVGLKDQDWFLNIAVEIETELTPYELLEHCNKVEHELKRERVIRWGPRTIDIDILLYDEVVLNDERLTIPHPRMTERGFVLIPLCEIAPDLIINGDIIGDIIERINTEEIRKQND